MDFTLTSEQEMLRNSARRYLADDFAGRRQKGAAAPSAAWRGYAELGWLALPVPEEAGGLGGNVEDLVILAEEMGRALVVQSFAATCLLTTRLVDQVATGDQRLKLLAGIATGDMRLSPALYEPGRRYSLVPETRAYRTEKGYRLSGTKCLVFGGNEANSMLVSARLDEGAVGLFQVPTDSDGVALSHYLLIDDGTATDVSLQEVDLDTDSLLGSLPAEILEDGLDEARLGICADALGALQLSVEMTAAYLKTRTQFGQPLANFQALQHSLVEMFIDVDSIRSAIFNAVSSFHRGSRHDRIRAVSSCWVKTFGAAKDVAGMAVHLHGGIGMTSEYPVGHVLRRMIVSERSFGDIEFHLGRYMEAGR